eukprot:8260360-Pyramimonas_sp.AAC.1
MDSWVEINHDHPSRRPQGRAPDMFFQGRLVLGAGEQGKGGPWRGRGGVGSDGQAIQCLYYSVLGWTGAPGERGHDS